MVMAMAMAIALFGASYMRHASFSHLVQIKAHLMFLVPLVGREDVKLSLTDCTFIHTSCRKYWRVDYIFRSYFKRKIWGEVTILLLLLQRIDLRKVLFEGRQWLLLR